jgi:CMP-N-acetylneuraminic acid synthetase|tara:strand:- start:178 stop:921 length:744 start_codon:yes stop_codon:yes gene_type:complete
MYNKNKVKILGIITARKGSKGVKNKNLKKINGKPLIFYTFDFIKKNKFFHDTILTTNSDKLIDYSKKFPFIRCPFKRPEYLSKDNSKQEDAILHALNWFEKKHYTPDYICILEPTTPFRYKNTFSKAVQILKNNKIDGVFTITKSRHDPSLIKTLRKDNLMKNWDLIVNNRQEYPDYFSLTSSAIIIKTSYFKKYKTAISSNSKAIVVNAVEGIMIDDKLDFFLVKNLIEKKISSISELNKYIDDLP